MTYILPDPPRWFVDHVPPSAVHPRREGLFYSDQLDALERLLARHGLPRPMLAELEAYRERLGLRTVSRPPRGRTRA